MKVPLLFSLLACSSLALANDVSDQLFEQLKTELRAEAKATAGKGDDRAYRYQEMLLQFPRGLSLANGSGNLLRSIEAISTVSTSDKVQEICKALSAELRGELEKREKEQIAEMEKTFGAAIRAGLNAKIPKDIDEPLVSAGKYLSENSRQDTENPKLRVLYSQAQLLSDFLRQWQDYLAQIEAGNAEAARQTLMNLSSNSRDFSSFMPRSELLARLAPLVKASRPRGSSEEAQLSVAEFNEALRKIITETSGLDALPEAIRKVEELGTLNSSMHSSKTSTFLSSLRSMQRTYEDVKRGLASRITVPSISGSIGFGVDERLNELQSQLTMFALPRVLGLPEGQSAQPGENVATFHQRILDQARKNQDWPLVARVLDNAQTLNLGTIVTTNDSTAMRSFLAGWNQEQARQWSLAVSSYQAALKTGSQIVPPTLIGEHLDAIQKSNPAEFAQGMQIVLTPPPAQDPRMMYDIRTGRPAGYPGSYPFSPVREAVPAGREASIPVPAKITPEAKPSTSPGGSATGSGKER